MNPMIRRSAIAAVPCFILALTGCPSSNPSDAATDAAAEAAPSDVGVDGTAESGSADVFVDAPLDAVVDAPADATDVLMPPLGCVEITLTTMLRSTQMTNPEAYDTQPDLQATASLSGSTGDALYPNDFFFYLDSADAVGTSYPAVAFTSYYYARPNGGGISGDYVPAADGGVGGYSHRWVAVSGTVQITAAVTPHQTTGQLSNVRLEEATRGSDGSVTMVPGGSCFWLRSATWDTRRPNGCAPFTSPDPCPAGHQCMPTNAIGDDGTCTAFGTATEGTACTHTDGTWDSECAAGLRCAYFTALGDTGYTCHSVCNPRSTGPNCPAHTHCGGGYDTCMPIAYLMHDTTGANEIDTVDAVGTVCAQNPTALYCGAAMQPGTCFRDTGAASPMCRGWMHAGSECPGQYAGYAAYKSGIDRSTLFCFH